MIRAGIVTVHLLHLCTPSCLKDFLVSSVQVGMQHLRSLVLICPWCVSPKYQCAARYPLALATRQGEVIGEYVADDVYPLRVVLQCFAPVSKRRIKIRAPKTNQQDANLPEDDSVHSVISVACGAAPECQGWVERVGRPAPSA